MRDPTHQQNQQGIVMVVTAIALVAIIGTVGLALDFGHAFVNKTRLQNVVDAAALAAAKNIQNEGTLALATQAAYNILAANKAADGNEELAGLQNEDMLVEFSLTGIPFVNSNTGDEDYVRVSIANLSLASRFIQIFGKTEKTVAASAVAGPSPSLGTVCDIAPMMVCGEPSSGGNFFGYEVNDIQVLKTSAGGSSDVGPGNFQLIRLGDSQGGADVREALAGDYTNCVSIDEPVTTEPGNTIGPVVQGFNTRFGQYAGPFSEEDRTQYPPDLVITENTTPIEEDAYGDVITDETDLDYNFDDWKQDLTSCLPAGACEPGGQYGRRLMAIPIGDCSGTINGSGEVTTFGFGCFFMLQTVNKKGNDANISGQFVEGCDAHGYVGSEPGNENGPKIIQLYENVDSVDS